MPLITGLLETALYVDDVARSREFYERLMGFERLTADDRLAALSIPGRQVLLLFRNGSSTTAATIPGGVIPPHDGSGHLHVAFSISRSDLEAWRQALQQNGIAIESEVSWPLGGHSIYFRDPDSHLIELATSGIWKTF